MGAGEGVEGWGTGVIVVGCWVLGWVEMDDRYGAHDTQMSLYSTFEGVWSLCYLPWLLG